MTAGSLLSRVVLPLLVALGAAGVARAQRVAAQLGSPCQCNGCPGTEQLDVHVGTYAGRPPSNIQDAIAISKFDRTKGTLVQVRYDAKVQLLSGLAAFENLNLAGTCEIRSFLYRLNVLVQDPFDAYFTYPGGPSCPPVCPPACEIDSSRVFCTSFGQPSCIDLAPFDGVVDHRGPSGTSFTFPPQVVRTSNPVTYCTDSPQLSAFLSPEGSPLGTVGFDLSTLSSQGQDTSCSNIDSSFSSNIRITITVTYTYCPNQPPEGTPDFATTCAGTLVDIPVLANDCDADGKIDCSSITIVDPPDHAANVVVAGCAGISSLTGCPQANNCPGCKVSYTPAAGYSGPDTFTYTVEDDDGCVSAPVLVTITVNAGPNAVNESVSTCKDTPVVIGILSNDVPAAATTLNCGSVFIADQPDHGTLALNVTCGGVSNGGCNSSCVRYTPTAGYAGPDNFTYRVTDSQGCTDTAVVSITVRAGPAAGPDSATTCQDTPVVIGLLQNDVPAGGATLNCGSVAITDQPDHGTLALNIACGGAANGGCNANCVRYTPTAGYNGPDSFQYTVSDSTGCTSNPATVAITVNAPPNAVNDTVATCKDEPVVIGILSNDVPAAATTLNCGSVFITDQPDHGTLALNVACGGVGNGGCNSNCVRYTPTSGYSGPDSFTYRITDSRGCTDTAVVSITVRAGPTAGPDNATTCQDTPVIVGILQNDVPEAGSTLTCNSVTITDQPDHGTLTLNLACGGAPNGGCTANCVRYTPTAGYNGSDSFQYTVNDSNGCTSNPATVTLTVNAPPNAVNDSAATCKNEPVVIGILSNDVPAATTTLVCNSVFITDQPDHGTLALSFACGGAPNGGCNSNCVQYTPTNGYSGPDNFTYRITDSRGCTDTAVVSITVRAGPTAGPDSATTCQDTPVVFGVLQNDVPEAGSTLTCNSVTITDQPDHGTLTLNLACGGAPNGGCTANCVRYTPTAGYNGSDSFQYTVNDSNGCTSNAATVAITIHALPNAANDNVSTCRNSPVVIGILSNDVPVATTTLVCNSVTITDQPDHGTVALNIACGGVGNGSCASSCVRYTPTNGYTGPDNFTYSITDSRGCIDSAIVSITVRAGPAAGPDNGTTCQDEPVIVGILQNDVPEGGSTLTCNSVVITDQPDHGTVALNIACGGVGNGSCGSNCVRYTPTAGYNGSDSFQYTVNDSNGCTSSPATVTITVNAPPNAVNDNVSTCRNSPVVIGLLQNDVPAATTTLVCDSVVITDQPDHGTLALNVACGSVTNRGCTSNCVRYTPTNGYVGPDSFTYSITDSRGCKDTAVVQIRVCAPIALPDASEVCQLQSVSINVLANDSGQESCGVINCGSITIVDPPDFGVAVPNAGCSGSAPCGSCRVVYSHNDPDHVGPDSFKYTVKDSSGCVSLPATVTIQVKPAPRVLDRKIIKDPASSAPITNIPVLDGATPGQGCTLVASTLTIVSPPSFGQAVVNPNGTITYTPGANFPEEDTFCFRVANSCGCTDEGCVEINEPPITCFERNRLQCGSLLLFPEFSTRPGEQTMYTITDACCNSQGTYVEFIFIKEGTCLEENRTFFLTPCDTLTFLTNMTVGPNQRGYAYAYAKSGPAPGATPTVFNHLIGDLLFLDGVFQAQYAINAVSFKGIGLEGSLNDEDNDGVLDLDGLTEYEEAPDELYIPRFLGETENFHSDLVLIALSGGTAFHSNGGTEIGIRMFDDNENAFSIGYEFYCWAKPRLLEISGAFSQSFLHNDGGPIDDPDEIFGWQGREAGWFSINGLFAHSTAETINDPAVYAVLVEHWGNRAAAELPFEFCSQTNGDLLPNSVYGDPRPGAPSGLPDDNQ